jgi:uncharacterized C2H2 Zn-finger protein
MAKNNTFDTIELKDTSKAAQYFVHQDLCLYSAYRERDGVIYLKCTECECHGKIEGDIFTRTDDRPHSHEKNHEKEAEFKKTYAKLRKAVKTEHNSIRKIHHNIMRGDISRYTAKRLAWKHCRKTLQRARSRQLPVCQSLKDLESLLEDEGGNIYKMFGQLRGKRFYQGAPNGHLVFANLELIAELPPSFHMFVDGTFKVTPFNALQLLVVMAELGHKPRPIAYVVMNGKSGDDYREVFEFFRDGIFSFDGNIRTPVRCSSDFEQAIRRALTEVWPEIVKIGCNFHFCQALRKNAGSGITGSPEKNWILVLFMRLSLLPLNRVDTGFDKIIELIETRELVDDYQEFVNYFQQTWFVRYAKDSWNVSEFDRRTNNHVEGHNNAIKKIITIKPSHWDFLDSLLDLALDTLADYDSDVENNRDGFVDRSYLSQPLRESLLQLNEGTIDEFQFLKNMAKSFKPQQTE